MANKTASLDDRNEANNPPAVDDFSFDLFGILRRQRWWIALAILVGGLVGLSYLLLKKPTYESKAQILLMQNESANMAARISTEDSSISSDLLATHMTLLQGKRIVRDSLKSTGLDQDPSILHNVRQDETSTDYVIDNLYVTKGGSGAARDARTLTLAFQHDDPQICQDVVNAILVQYKSFISSKFKDVNAEAVSLINKARHEMEADIDRVYQDYRAFRAESPILSSTEGGANIFALRYEEIAAEISQLLISIDQANSRLTLVTQGLERMKDTGTPELEKLTLIDEENAARLSVLVTVEQGGSQTVAFQASQPERMAGASAEYNALLKLKTDLRRAMQDFGAEHPEVKTLNTQINEMEEFFVSRQKELGGSAMPAPLTPDGVMSAYVTMLKNDLEALKLRKSDLELQMMAAEGEAKKLVDFELQDQDFTREIARQSELFNSIVARLRDLNIQQDSSAMIQEVTEDPEIGKKVSPNAPVAVGLSLISTILLATGLILMRELSDRKIHSAEELETLYDSNILCHVPDFNADRDMRTLVREVEKEKSPIASSLLCYHRPKSGFSESFRSLRTQLLFALKSGHKVIVVTSSKQGEGKSTTSTNLFSSFANTGKSVLLVDADMRRPEVHTLFGMKNDLGLVDVLNGHKTIDEVIKPGPADNLSLILAGPTPENPAELLVGSRLSEFANSVRERYDYVIFDCPPMLAVTDPAIISEFADHVLLVTSVQEHDRATARQSKKILDSVNATLAGLVVNRTKKDSSGYVYSNYSTAYKETYGAKN